MVVVVELSTAAAMVAVVTTVMTVVATVVETRRVARVVVVEGVLMSLNRQPPVLCTAACQCLCQRVW